MGEARINENLKSFINWFTFEDRYTTDRYNVDIEFYSRLPFLLNLCNIITENFGDYNYRDINFGNLTKNDFFSKTKLVSTFFKDININIDIEKLINNGYIKSEFLNKEEIKKNTKKYFEAHCDDLKNNNYDILVPECNFTSDSIIMTHELGHYLSNNDCNNSVCNFFSEVPSIYVELLYYDYLKSIGYSADAEELQKVRFSNFNNIAKKFIPMIKVLDVYLTFGELNKQNYNKLYNDDYEQTLQLIDNTELLYRLKRDLRYIVGFFMAIIMRQKYKEDMSYCVNFDKFNKNMNSLTFEEILQTLDINLLNDNNLKELTDYIEEYKGELRQNNIKC